MRPLSLKMMAFRGFQDSLTLDKKIFFSANFVREELPVRLSRGIQKLSYDSHGLHTRSSVKRVADWYKTSLEVFNKIPRTIADEKEMIAFNKSLQHVASLQSTVVPTMAKGVLELWKAGLANPTDSNVQGYLADFLLLHIGISTLVRHHLELPASDDRQVGVVDVRCSPAEGIEWVTRDVRDMCMLHFGDAPEIIVEGATSVQFPFIPHYLHAIAFELLKNACRANVERAQRLKSAETPPVRVLIAEGAQDITIRISDQGGGLPRAVHTAPFLFLSSNVWKPSSLWNSGTMSSLQSAERLLNEEDGEGSFKSHGHGPMTGFGFGVPISRLYALHFGGDLKILPVDGYGTDAYVMLPKNGDSREIIPR